MTETTKLESTKPQNGKNVTSGSYTEYIQSILRSTWKSFAYDHSEQVQKIRREAEYCLSAFIIFCSFCLVCAVSFNYIEGAHQEELLAQKDVDDQDVSDLVLQKETQAVEDLWLAASTMSEEEWKATAMEKVKQVNEESLDLHGCQPRDSGPCDWGMLNSFVYMLTVTTSIGYGHIYPSTNAGRALTIVYAILGIPIFLILMADFGKLFTRLLKALFVFVRRVYRTATCRRLRKTKAIQKVKTPTVSSPTPPLALPESSSGEFDKQDDETGHRRQSHKVRSSETRPGEDEDSDLEEETRPCCASACYKDAKGKCTNLCSRFCKSGGPEEEPEEETVIDDNFNLPISLALLILLVYILIGCIIYTIWEEDWTYFTAFYFIFISMTTIGFGDLVPKHPAYMMITTLYLVFGLALTAMCINIIQEKLTDTFRKASEKLKESLAKIMTAAMQGEEGQEGKEVEVAEIHSPKKQTDAASTESVTMKKET